jgi:hypothetical protein
MAWARRLKSPRSRLSINRMNRENPIHKPAVLLIESIEKRK